MMLGYLVISGLVLTRLRRPLARFTIEEQRLEGEFRNVNSRLITHSEEIAFYGGNQREQETMNSYFPTLFFSPLSHHADSLNRSFARLVRHLRKSMQFRFAMGITDSIITKYVGSGVVVCGSSGNRVDLMYTSRYFATVVGFLIMSRGFIAAHNSGKPQEQVMEEYYRNGRMLMSLAGAVGRLVLAGKFSHITLLHPPSSVTLPHPIINSNT